MTPAEDAERIHQEREAIARRERVQRMDAFHYGWETDASERLDRALALAGIAILTLLLIGMGTVGWGAWRTWKLWMAV